MKILAILLWALPCVLFSPLVAVGLITGFVWFAVLGYVWSIARRLKTVESELTTLEGRKR